MRLFIWSTLFCLAAGISVIQKHGVAKLDGSGLHGARVPEGDSCDPECLKGRGVCHAGICFCVTPYEGTMCQRTVNTEKRFSYPIFIAILLVALSLGVAISFGINWMTESKQVQFAGPPSARRESWMPQRGS
eukprot:GEMP01058262.1.p1 GENE.GEMP01058262.1~~GEMP01058262.1.p1  ORF type:complete len:132 (+),score=10.45 GEMP01058262.1:273-668(+)